MKKQYILCHNNQEQRKDTTFEKFSEQVVQSQKLQYDVPKSQFQKTDGMWP